MLTAKILFYKARFGTTSTSDGSKILQIKKFVLALCQKFFLIDPSLDKSFDNKKLSSLSEEDADLLAIDSHIYYVAKLTKGYKYI